MRRLAQLVVHRVVELRPLLPACTISQRVMGRHKNARGGHLLLPSRFMGRASAQPDALKL